MTSPRFRFMVLVLFLMLAGAKPLLAAEPVTTDAMFLRGPDRDALILRPWLERESQGPVLLGIPANAEVRIAPDMPLDLMRLAVWEGERPLSRLNEGILATLCEKEVFRDLKPAPTHIAVTAGTMQELQRHCDRAGLDLDAGQVATAQSLFADGLRVLLLEWEPVEVGRGHFRIPLAAIALIFPERVGEIPVHWPASRRGCLGTILLVADQPLVPGEQDRSYWDCALHAMDHDSLAQALSEVGLAVPGSPVCVIAALHQCDDQASLHPVGLDPSRDLGGSMSLVAAAWYGRHPSDAAARSLRAVLADTSRTDENVLFCIWAWDKQDTPDRRKALKPWLGSSNGRCRSEAITAYCAGDRDCFNHLVLGSDGPSDDDWSRALRTAGLQMMQAPDSLDSLLLTGVMDHGDPLMTWLEQPPKNERYDFGRVHWATLALANLGDERALATLADAIGYSGLQLVNRAGQTQRNRARSLDNLVCGLLLDTSLLRLHWPLMQHFLLATRNATGLREQVLDRVLAGEVLPPELVPAVLAAKKDWSGSSMDNVWGALIFTHHLNDPLIKAPEFQTARMKLTLAGMGMAFALHGWNRQLDDLVRKTRDPQVRDLLLDARILSRIPDFRIRGLRACGPDSAADHLPSLSDQIRTRLLVIWPRLLKPVKVAADARYSPPPPRLENTVPLYRLRMTSRYLIHCQEGRQLAGRLLQEEDLHPAIEAFIEDCLGERPRFGMWVIHPPTTVALW